MDMFINKRDSEEVRRLKTRFLEGFLKFLGDYQKYIEYTNHIFQLLQNEPDDETVQRRKLMT